MISTHLLLWILAGSALNYLLGTIWFEQNPVAWRTIDAQDVAPSAKIITANLFIFLWFAWLTWQLLGWAVSGIRRSL